MDVHDCCSYAARHTNHIFENCFFSTVNCFLPNGIANWFKHQYCDKFHDKGQIRIATVDLFLLGFIIYCEYFIFFSNMIEQLLSTDTNPFTAGVH